MTVAITGVRPLGTLGLISVEVQFADNAQQQPREYGRRAERETPSSMFLRLGESVLCLQNAMSIK